MTAPRGGGDRGGRGGGRRWALLGGACALGLLLVGAWWLLGGAQGELPEADPSRATPPVHDTAPTPPARPPAAAALPPVARDDAAPAVTPVPDAALGRTPPPAGPVGRLVTKVSWEDGTPAADVAMRIQVWDPADPHPERLRGRTDAEGRFVREGVPAGGVTVHADRGANVVGKVAAFADTELELTLPEGHAITGTVYDAGGRPAAGADVWLMPERDAAAALQATRTDAAGRFALEHVAKGSYLGASLPGRLPSAPFKLQRFSDRVTDVDLILGLEAGTVAGRVTDEAGAPVADALVEVRPFEPPEAAPGRPSAAFDPGVPCPPDPPPPGPLLQKLLRRQELGWMMQPLHTDADGRFTMPAVPPGPVRVIATARGAARTEAAALVVAGETAEVDVVLPPSPILRGTVRDGAGRALPGATVEVVVPGEAEGVVAFTGSDGAYTLTGAPVGTARTIARIGGARHPDASTTAQLELRAGEVLTWDPVLALGRRLEGRVVDAAGAPAGRHILTVSSHGPAVERTWRAPTDDEGRFSLVRLPPGTVSIDVFPYMPADSELLLASVREVEPGDEELVLVLPPAPDAAARVTGRLVDEAGRPVDDARAKLVPFKVGWSSRVHEPVAMDVDPGSGGFDSGPMEAGRWRLEVAGADDGRALKLDVRLVPGQELDLGALELPTPGLVRVTLEGEGELPFSFWPLRLERLGPDGRWETPDVKLPLKERVATAAMAPGAYRVSVTVLGYANRTAEFTVVPGGTTELSLPMQPGATLRVTGVLPDDAGEQPSAELALLDVAGGPAYRTVLRSVEGMVDGHATVAAIFSAVPGVYRAQVLLPGRPVREQVIRVGPPTLVPQDVLIRLD